MATSELAESLPLIYDAPITVDEAKPTLLDFLKRYWVASIIGFGGPPAHVALFHQMFVDTPSRDPMNGKRLPHMTESVFLELYALCQSLPGPGSTQLGTALGATFGGLFGGFVAFFIFFLPGFIIMSCAGVWYNRHSGGAHSAEFISRLNEYLCGLIAAAFAMVLIAAYKIITKCCMGDKVKWAVAVLVSGVAVCVPPKDASLVFIFLLLFGGFMALVQSKISANGNENRVIASDDDMQAWDCGGISPGVGLVLVATFFALALLAIISNPTSQANHMLKVFWTIGSIGFGGGIVVIPMLLNEVVESGLLANEIFLAGFALFGVCPGPMYNMAPFLGAAMAGWPGAFRGAIGLFAPGIIIVLGLLPFWEQIRKKALIRTFVQGVNSAAAGLIGAGIWMLLKRVMIGPASYSLVASAGVAIAVFQMPIPLAIVSHGALGALLVLLNIGGPFAQK